jgi:hypothetical protein
MVMAGQMTKPTKDSTGTRSPGNAASPGPEWSALQHRSGPVRRNQKAQSARLPAALHDTRANECICIARTICCVLSVYLTTDCLSLENIEINYQVPTDYNRGPCHG